MAAVQSPSNLVELAQKLEIQRNQHAESAQAIASTLEEISSLLSSLLGGSRPTGSTAKPKSLVSPGGAKAMIAPAPKSSPTAAKAGKPPKLGMTGEQSILAFIRRKNNPTSAEIEAHWKSEGRGSSAKNLLSKLFKEKKLNREPNKQGRGSRYTLA